MTATTHQPVDSQNKRGLFQQLELDVRLLGMIGAFIILCIGFNILTDGRFLTPPPPQYLQPDDPEGVRGYYGIRHGVCDCHPPH